MKKTIMVLVISLIGICSLGAVDIASLDYSYEGETLSTGRGQVVVEDFLQSYYEDPAWVHQVAGLDSLTQAAKEEVLHRLDSYIEDPSFMGVVFLGMFGGMGDGLYLLDEFSFPLAETTEPSITETNLAVSGVNMFLHMAPSADYQNLEFEFAIDGDVELYNLIHQGYNLHRSLGTIDVQLSGDINLMTEEEHMVLDGELTELMVLDTPEGGVKIITSRSLIADTSTETEDLENQPVTYVAYNNHGETLFSGTCTVSGYQQVDMFSDLLDFE